MLHTFQKPFYLGATLLQIDSFILPSHVVLQEANCNHIILRASSDALGHRTQQILSKPENELVSQLQEQK